MSVERRQPALARAANAMVRALGGGEVKLRIALASTGGTQRELGISPAAYQELVVAPVIVRQTAAGKNAGATQPGAAQIEVLISSTVLESAMPGFGTTDGREFLESVQQVVYSGIVFSVTEVGEDRFGGLAYLYHVTALKA